MPEKSQKNLKICLKNEIKPDGRERSLWSVVWGMVVGWCGGRCGVARGMVVGGRALMEGRIFKEET